MPADLLENALMLQSLQSKQCISAATQLLDLLQEGGTLPEKGKAVTDQRIAQDMLADLEEQRSDIEGSESSSNRA